MAHRQGIPDTRKDLERLLENKRRPQSQSTYDPHRQAPEYLWVTGKRPHEEEWGSDEGPNDEDPDAPNVANYAPEKPLSRVLNPTSEHKASPWLQPSDRVWLHETIHGSNMKTQDEVIRPPVIAAPEALGENFNWFADATTADAILPPEVPMPGMELLVSEFRSVEGQWLK